MTEELHKSGVPKPSFSYRVTFFLSVIKISRCLLFGIKIFRSSFRYQDLFGLQCRGPKKHAQADPKKKTISIPNNRVQNLDTKKRHLDAKTKLRPPRYHKKDISIPKKDARFSKTQFSTFCLSGSFQCFRSMLWSAPRQDSPILWQSDRKLQLAPVAHVIGRTQYGKETEQKRKTKNKTKKGKRKQGKTGTPKRKIRNLGGTKNGTGRTKKWKNGISHFRNLRISAQQDDAKEHSHTPRGGGH